MDGKKLNKEVGFWKDKNKYIAKALLWEKITSMAAPETQRI